MSKAAVYVRSARPSPEAIERQLRQCAQAAEREGLVLDSDLTYEDVGVSANRPPDQRPGYRRMAEVLRSGAVDTLVVNEICTLSRSVEQLVEVLKLLRAAGIRLVWADGNSFLYGMAERLLLMSLNPYLYLGKPFCYDGAAPQRPRKW